MNLLRPLLALTYTCSLSSLAAASFTQAVTPSFRGAPCTRFAGWETFTSPFAAPNAPDVPWSTTLAPALTQLVPGAILTTTGNIYHPLEAQQFELEDVAGTDVQEVVLQVSTFGNSTDFASFGLSYVDSQGATVALAPTNFQILVQSGGHDELYVHWDLASVADGILSYTLHFVATAANLSLDALQLDVRELCPPGTGFCSGDGSATPCPCGNPGATGRGCASSVNAAGGLLEGSGFASLAADSLVLRSSGTTNSTCLFFQGSLAENGGLGVQLGDGLRCVGGTLVRLGSSTAVGGQAQYPAGTQAVVSVRGGITVPGTSAVYQTWYRNAAPAWCTPDTFNLTNGYEVVWQP